VPRLRLVIGNKNYSSWSMRPWVLMRQAAIPFEEVQLWFDQNAHAQGAERYSPTGLVPVLMVDDEPVWDSLAICEALADLFPGKHLWPADPGARRTARAACAEMHAGFRALRNAMPMNIRASLPGKGMVAGVRQDIDRITALWADCQTRYGCDGAFLFGDFTIADAFYAPVVMRFSTYAVNLPSAAQAYVDAVCALSSVQDWMAAGRVETGFVAADEPYAP
jgi:glutathione S-transferase